MRVVSSTSPRGGSRIADDRGPSRAKDAGLLAADAVAIVAEPVLMIEVDRGDDRGVGVDDVDCIEPAAEADFEQRDVEFASREQHSAASVPNSK